MDDNKENEQASQSQAAQPTDSGLTEAALNLRALAKSGRDLRNTGEYYKLCLHDVVELERVAQLLDNSAAHIAGTSQTTKAQAEPIYQVYDNGLRVWGDVTEDAYNIVMPSKRRIVYAAEKVARKSGAAQASHAGADTERAQREAVEAKAKEIYATFCGAEDHPWVEGGNSDMQFEARLLARAAMSAATEQKEKP